MKTQKIYGASDDLIELEGPIYDEVDCYDCGTINIECSDGTKVEMTYNGDWVIEVIINGDKYIEHIGSVNDEHTEANAIGCTSYSDVLVLEEVEWVKINGKKYTK